MAARATPYHRPSLEQDLLEHAAEIIATRGVEALSLRELGRVAGVSRTAPYHYFEDKSALLARVGQAGFQRLGRRIAQATADGQEPLDQLRAGLRAYVAFAEEERHFFRLMFANVLERGLSMGAKTDIDDTRFSSHEAMQVFGVLLSGVSRMQKEGVLADGDPWLLVNVFWSFAHGVAMLAAGHNLKRSDSEAVFEAGMHALIDANTKRE